MLVVNAAKAEILLYDVIGAGWFDDGITAKSVIEALAPLTGNRVTVRINSPGGVVDEGIAIYNALKRHEGGVDTVVDSLAASIASIIALAGESRTTSAGSRWMIHRASTIGIGNANDFRKLADVLAKHDDSLLEIYATHLDKPREEIETMLDAETWFTSDEAVAAGLATSKAGDAVEKPTNWAWFRNPPKDLVASAGGSIRNYHLSKVKLARLRAATT
jgi:ATP-dependent protease ClpP protease subunit